MESSFEPEITCPKDTNEVSVSIKPSNSKSDSTVNSPVFNVEVVINGEKQVLDLELGEIQTIDLQDEQNSITAEASVDSLDQPGILSFTAVEEDCTFKVDIETTLPETPEEVVVIDTEVDCEVTPDLEECKEPFVIPWWLIALLILTLLAILWYLWNRRYLRTGTFVISNNLGEQGRIRVLKKTRTLAFNVNENAEVGSQVTKSSPEVYGTYEVTKGKKGSDFKISGPAGSGSALEGLLQLEIKYH